MFDYRLFIRNNAQPVFFSIYKTLNITKSNFFQHCAKLHFIVNFQSAYFFCPFFILGICTIALVAYKECTAVFHNTVNLCKAFFKIFPKIYRLKQEEQLKFILNVSTYRKAQADGTIPDFATESAEEFGERLKAKWKELKRGVK